VIERCKIRDPHLLKTPRPNIRVLGRVEPARATGLKSNYPNTLRPRPEYRSPRWTGHMGNCGASP